MTNDDAKFVLRAYRPDGRDAGDPLFSDALEQAKNDPALRAWWEREQALDAAVSEKLRSLAPPQGLRESILAGAHLSASPAWWRRSTWQLAAAAAVAVLFAIIPAFAPGLFSKRLDADGLARFAMADVQGSHDGAVHAASPGTVLAWLEDPANRLLTTFSADPARLKKERCRVVRVAGRDVFEICFRRDAWYHIYIVPRDGIGLLPSDATPTFREQSRFATATWADAHHAFVLVTDAGVEALRRVL